jgi:hypothetical protein
MNPHVTSTPELTPVVLDVLGDLAFMVTDDHAGAVPFAADWLHGEVHYFGKREGILRCWCTRTFAARLAANLLGIEPEEAQAQGGALDAVREFLNVLCGQLITKWHGTSDVFNLSIPQVRVTTHVPADALRDPAVCRLSIEGQPLVCLHVPA